MTVTTQRRAVSTASRRMPHLPGLATLVGVQVLLALGMIIWIASGSPWGWIALLTALLIALAFIPLGERASAAAAGTRRIGFAWSRMRRRSAELTPAPFDIPITRPPARGARTAQDPGGHVGARWAGGTLITVLRVSPAAPAPTHLTPHGGIPGTDEGQLIPLTALAMCIDPFDIPLASIDVITRGVRLGGTGRVAAAYDRTLGPLPATAHRSVYVVLRLDPTDCADAVARRGGGATGALRTATITTRRVARRLTETGLQAVPLNAAEITSVTTQLTEGAALESTSEEWQGVHAGRVRIRTAAIEPADLGRVLSTAWVNQALSTTTALRLANGPDGRLRVSALLRVAELPDAGRAITAWPRGAWPVDGRQFDALTATIPTAASARLFRHLPATSGGAAYDLLAAIALPAAGCGQLVGADHLGRAVAIPLYGPDVADVAVIGGHRLATLLTARIVATGAAVVVHTTRPDRWARLAESVGDPRQFSVHQRHPGAAGHFGVEVYDGVAPHPAPAGTTRLFLTQTDAPEVASATIVLMQDPRSPQDITVTTPDDRFRVTMVATDEEWTLIGSGPTARSVPPRPFPPAAPGPGRTPRG
ncbi:type VII secretion protein EccE [Gordonia sp. NPDC003425]